jgi:hypothetical protein
MRSNDAIPSSPHETTSARALAHPVPAIYQFREFAAARAGAQNNTYGRLIVDACSSLSLAASAHDRNWHDSEALGCANRFR